MKPQAFTPETDARLRDIYSGSASRRQFTARLDALELESGKSRDLLYYRATRLGLRFTSKRRWTATEDDYIRENVGEMSVSRIGSILGRSKSSVYTRIERMKLNARFRRGYSIQELSQCMGAAERTIHQWMKRGWLRRRDGRFTPETVNRFIVDHLEEISMRRADEEWLKMRLFEIFTPAMRIAA